MSASIYITLSQTHIEEHAMFRGVSDYSRNLQLGWDVIPVPWRQGPAEDPRLKTARPPAVMVGRAFAPQAFELFRSKGLLWVDWNFEGEDQKGDAEVSFDSESIGRTAAEYLAGAGARSFAVQRPGPGAPEPAERQLRHDAFLAAARTFGKPCRGLFEQPAGPSATADALIRWFCRSMPHPIGFFTYHDDVAEFLIQMLRNANVDIPNEALVLGCGNQASLQSTSFSLSSVDLPYYSLGVAAAAQAERLLSGLRPDPVRVPAMGVVERQSTMLTASGDPLLDSALSFATREEEPIPSVEALARLCRVDRRLLHAHFKRELGTTPKDWLMERAMQRACRLLGETNLTITDIGRQCGIGHRVHFHKRFKARFGITPGAYRKQLGRSGVRTD